MIKADSNILVYLIISIIVLILSAIRQNPKKAAQRTNDGENEESNDESAPKTNWPKGLDDVFGDIFNPLEQVKSEEPEPQKIPVNVTEHNILPIQSLAENAHSEQPRIKQESAEYSKSLNIKEINDDEFSAENLHLEAIDLKQAIIYSEIINRKYF